MARIASIRTEFVEFLPPDLEEGVLYVSMEYAGAVHKCFCGCGNRVATPFEPTDWKLIFDGTVTLHPSIGNWSFSCQSHYWIRSGRVEWAGKMTREEIERGRAADRLAKGIGLQEPAVTPQARPSWWKRLKNAFTK